MAKSSRLLSATHGNRRDTAEIWLALAAASVALRYDLARSLPLPGPDTNKAGTAGKAIVQVVD